MTIIRPLFVFAAALLVGLQALPARAQFGIAAGLNYEQMDDIDVSNASRSFEQAAGYHVGVFYDIGSGPIGVRIGAFYRDLGDIEITGSGVEGVNLTMFDFPLELRLSIIPLPFIRPYLLAGPVVSMPRSEDNDLNESLETLLVAGTVGGGLQLDLGSITLLPEFRYGISVTDLTGESFSVAGQQFDAMAGPRGNTVQLRLGLRF